jgi:cytochrome bd-type quinol oxidase subunit 2
MVGIRRFKLALVSSTAVALFALFSTTGLAYAQAQTQTQDQSQTQVQGQAQATVQSDSIADNVCLGVLVAQASVKPAPQTATVRSCNEDGTQSFGGLIRKIINTFSIVVGAVSVIMVIIGGFRYIVSGGDSSNISKAKNTILYSIVGLVIVIFAQIIVRFILTSALK